MNRHSFVYDDVLSGKEEKKTPLSLHKGKNYCLKNKIEPIYSHTSLKDEGCKTLKLILQGRLDRRLLINLLLRLLGKRVFLLVENSVLVETQVYNDNK